jgi:hypothetical protein
VDADTLLPWLGPSCWFWLYTRPQGQIYPLTVSSYIKQAWLDADRKPVTFYFASLKDAQPKLSFDLLGSWQGQALVLEDRGSMAMSFAPDGRAKGYLDGANSPKENTTGQVALFD